MLSILGVGFSAPEHRIDNNTLRALSGGGGSVVDNGILNRASTLPAAYLESTRNVDPKQALQCSSVSPTTLAVAALNDAMARAGIVKEQIGLLLAESATPLETTPGESQRVCNALSIKTNAFDVGTSGAALSTYCDLLMGWEDRRVPDYVALISTQALTQRISYDSNVAPSYFGDGGGAAIVSTRTPGRFRSRHSKVFRMPGAQNSEYSIDAFKSLQFEDSFLKNVVRPALGRCLNDARREWGVDLSKAVLIAPQFHVRIIEEIAAEHSISVERCWNSFQGVGNTAGAASFATLAERWNGIVPGTKILLVETGIGRECGMLLLEA